MRKIYLLLVLSFFINKIDAQVFQFGPKFGLNVSSLSNGDNLPINSTTLIEDNSDAPKLTVHLGLVFHVKLSKVLAFQPELLFSPEGFIYDDATISGERINARLDYYNIPLLLDFKLFKRNERVSLQFGPQFGFLTTDKIETKNSEFESFSPASKTNNSLVFGIQFGMKNIGIFFQVRYSKGLSNLWEDSNIKSSVASGSIGYLF